MAMTEAELANIIQSHIDDGIGSDSGDVSTKRQELMDRYMGELYGNEKSGQSKVITREVLETIEWTMPAVMRVFASAENTVEFDPEGAEDEKQAQQETDAVNFVFRKHNNGYTVIHNWVKSALLNPNSYVKVYRDESETTTNEDYSNLNDIELSLLAQDQELEFIGADLNESGTYDVKVKRTVKRGRNLVESVPEEEIIVDSEWSWLDLEGCSFVSHSPWKTRSQLRELGLSEAQLDMVASDDDFGNEYDNRREFADERNRNTNKDRAQDKFQYHEAYILVDFNGDGIAERRRVTMVGKTIFENEEVDDQPIISMAAILMPHKHTGLSYAELVLDMQDIKTTVMRQLLTNMYRANNPRTIVLKGGNLSDVLANRANGIIRAKRAGDITTEPVNPVIAQVIPLLDLLDQQKEMRSGVTRNGMGLDADILAKSTEGAFMGALEKADQRIEMLVRTIAETAIRPLFLKLHALLLKHGDVKEIKTKGQWIPIDPTQWRKRESMTVRVGIGLGDKKQKMFAATTIISEQDKLLQAGMGGVLVSPQNIYEGRKLLTEAAGELNVDKYFMNPELQPPPPPPPPPPPDPNLLLIQSNKQIEDSKRQVDMARLQQQGQIEAAKIQFQQASAFRESQFASIKLEYEKQIDALNASLTSDKNDNDAVNKAMANRIKSLETDLKDAQADESLLMDKYKADLKAKTDITLKVLDRDNPGEVADESSSIENAIQGMVELITQMNMPKEIVSDDNGNPIGIRNTGTGEVKTIVIDDETGLPVGIE